MPSYQPLVDRHPQPRGDQEGELRDPATDELLARLPVGDASTVDAAVAAAVKAAPDWARTAPAARAGLVKAAARAVAAAADELALLTTREMGKPLADARGGVDAGVGAMEQYAELGPLHRGKALRGGWDAVDLMVPEPYGVAGIITPWNDPVAIVAQLLAAALVTGNTVVLKPSERAPLSALRLVELVAPHLPEGVVSLVLGAGEAGAALAASPDVDVVLHVGSTATGRSIAAACASRGAKALLENGGSDALVVDADVDPVWAADQAALGAFANAGQICTAVERVFVHADIAEPFLAALGAAARARVLGPGTDPATTLGPLVDRRHRDGVHAAVTASVTAGARLLSGGEVPDGPGAFYPATVLTDVQPGMPVVAEELFGPVAPVTVVSSYDEGLARAADSVYGLAATVLTNDPAHAQQAVRELPVGTVKINAVFGGAPGGAAQPRRASGQGFGYGPELLDEVTRVKVVHWTTTPGGTPR